MPKSISCEKLATRLDLREIAIRLRYGLTMRLGAIAVACMTILIAVLPLVLR